jgi:hypothetical protein
MDRLKTGEVNLGVRRVSLNNHTSTISFPRTVLNLTAHRSTKTCMQTSIMAVQFEGGVVVGADSRTTTGSYIVRRLICICSQKPNAHTPTHKRLIA